MSLTVIYPKPRTSQPHPENRVYPYLLRDLAVSRPDQVWLRMSPTSRCVEVFCTWWRSWTGTAAGFCPWRLSNTLEPFSCCEALEEALNRYDHPEIFNTDQGSQFTSAEFTGLLKEAGVRISMDGLGPLDGQHLHRASVAFTQIRMRLSERFRNRVGGPSRDRPLDQSIQQRETSLGTQRSDARRGVHWLGQEI